MKSKTIIGWILTGVVSLIFIGSALMKLLGSPETLDSASKLGVTPSSVIEIGILQILCTVVFIIPRTGIIGNLLLIAYMGGAIATHLVNGISIIAPCAISVLVWIAAFVRFPELSQKILGRIRN
ncbi:MAG: DoxX family protein [Cyclobacteriaceae bacterium]